MQIDGEGQMRHTLYGDYGGIIALALKSESCAEIILKVLKVQDSKWNRSPTNSNVLVWRGNSQEVKEVTELLGKYGANKKAITSMKYSVDFGEPFTVRFNVNVQG